jgi:ABC-type nitrate/sulfonate/bicarbonate transport system substrate-binding protein
MERGHFQRHGLHVEISYTPGSQYLITAVREGLFEIGHAAADDVVADVESHTDSDLFLFMGLHSGLLSLVGSREHRDIESLRGKTLAVDARHSGFVFILEKMLRSRGFGAKDYRLVEVGGWEKRYYALLEGKVSATLLTEPYIGDAVEAGCHLLARGDEFVPVYQATCGVASRTWARENAEMLVSYIRAYVEATEWCFKRENRKGCLALLARHNGIRGASAEKTLDALLDPKHGLYPMAELNLPGIAAALELRAEMGYLSYPVPSPEKYVDLSYHRKAVPSH